MSKKNLLSGRDKELQELAEQYEAAKAENKPIYLDADDLADLADWYAMHGKSEQATEVVEYGLRLHPNSTPLLVEQAYLFMDAQKRDKAKQIIDQIPESYSSEVKVLKANILLGEGKVDEAEQLLDSIEDKDELANIVDIAYMYIDMGYPDKALSWLNKGLNSYSEEEAFLAATADCFHAQGLNQKAETFYNKLIDKNPYSAPYWFGLARCYFEQQLFDKAIEACDYAIVADEEFAEAYIMKGHAFYQLGNEESALENNTLAEKYKAINPDFLKMFMGLNEIAKGHWEEGYQYIEQIIQSGDIDFTMLPSLYAHAGLCLYKLGKKRKANQYFKKSHEIDPEDVDPYLIEGRMYMEDDNFNKAIEKWATALDYAPYADTWNEIGIYCMELGQLSYARLAFEHVLDLDPHFENINEKLASLSMLLKDKENFLKYNQLCKHPFQQEDLEKLKELLESEDKEELVKAMRNILNALQ